MARDIEYDGEFIVGGRPGAFVTPNFQLKEFLINGRVRVARELVGALQELRDAQAAPVAIESLRAAAGLGSEKAGCFAFVSAAEPERLLAAARNLVQRSVLAKAKMAGSRLYVECLDPLNLPPLAAEDAFDRAVRITAGYETSGDPYQQVTGNFDGAGLSFGPLQVNFGTGTLPTLFERFRVADQHLLAACFGRLEHWIEWQNVLAMPERRKQVEWADRRSTGPRKAQFAEPWRSYLQAVGRVEAFQRATLQFAYDVYGRKLIVALSWLTGLWGRPIADFNCLAALFDLCVQQGSLDKAHAQIRRRVQEEKPKTQTAFMHIAVEERGRTASLPWRADCVSRRLGILYREPCTVTIDGRTSARKHPRLYMIRNTRVTGAEKYLS